MLPKQQLQTEVRTKTIVSSSVGIIILLAYMLVIIFSAIFMGLFK